MAVPRDGKMGRTSYSVGMGEDPACVTAGNGYEYPQGVYGRGGVLPTTDPRRNSTPHSAPVKTFPQRTTVVNYSGGRKTGSPSDP